MKLIKLFESKELNSELIWFQRYITDHDLSTQMEIEDDKIVFWVGEKFIKWNVSTAQRMRTKVLSDADHTYNYVQNVIKARFDLIKANTK